MWNVCALGFHPVRPAVWGDPLYDACETKRETAVLALLAEAAFRANAIERARLLDVWDPQHAVIRDTICLMDKGSTVRT